MNMTSKILFSLIAASAPLAASAIVSPPPPPAAPLYVGNFSTPEIDTVGASGSASTFAYLGYSAVGLAFNGNGQLFAALGNNQIYQFDSQGNATLFANTGLNGVDAIAFDGGGNLYAANLGTGAGNGYIEKYNSLGAGSVFAMTGTIQPSGGLAFDNSGNLYVAEEGNSSIVKYNSQGNATPFAGGLAAYAMTYYNNYLYVATASDAIYKVDSLGNATLFANTDLNIPEGMAFDPNGNLFVANQANGTIAEFDQQGNGSIFATETFVMHSIAIVPEPATWTILALGAGALIGRRRLFSRGI
jgi:sugar lactone lactonase YvrE